MNWKKIQFKDAVLFPPKVNLEKGENYSFIPMEEISSGIKYVSANLEKTWSGSGGAKFEEGDTLFARITPCLQNGKISQAKGLKNGKGFGSTEYFIFRGIEGISDNDFVYYLSLNEEFKKNAIGSMVGASGRQRADQKFVGEYEINLPPLQTQKRIASILSAYDDFIENNLKRIKLLEETAQNIYKEWFVNFRFPNYENTPFNRETGLPEGWEVKKIEDCEIKIGDGNYSAKYPKTEDFIESGIPFFSTREMNEGRFKTNGVKRISEEQHLTLTKGHLKGGDVILSTRGSIGKVVYVDNEFEDCNINAQLVLFRCDNVNVYSKFLYYQLSMPQTFLRLINVGTGTAQPQLPIKTLKYFELLIASPKLQQSFDNVVNSNMEQISILSKQNEKLKEARDILLPRLMSRTIEV
jgi:type I restriction enzyme S subunit